MAVEYAVRAVVSVEGQQLDPALNQYVEQVVVDDSLLLPDMFTITFVDPEQDMLERAGLRVGAKVEVSGSAVGRPEDRPLIKAEVTALEGDYDGLGKRIVVRGYDQSHRLHRGRQTVLYHDATDSDIARQVAERAGLAIGEIEATEQSHEWLSQANQTDWEFLQQRAHEIGYEVAVSEGKFYFRQQRESAGAPGEGDLRTADSFQLVYGAAQLEGASLLELHTRVSSAEQVAQVEVHGWDTSNKRTIVATADAGTRAAELDGMSPAAFAQEFGSPRFIKVDRTLATSAEADALARTIAERIGSAFVEADGVARGDPQLRAGSAVSIAGVAPEFVGRFVLSQTRHVFDRDGYRTHFTIGGRRQRSLLGLVTVRQGAATVTAGGGGGGSGSSRIAGLVRATVTHNDDPLEQGRVRIRVPSLADDHASGWAPVMQLGAGPDSGTGFLPEVGDEVLVGFEQGDINYPVVIGGLHNGVDKPRLGDSLFNDGRVLRRGIISRRGHRLIFFDDDGDSGIALLTSDGNIRFALKETDREAHLYCDGKVIIESGMDMTLKSGTALSIEAGTQLTLKAGTGAKLEAAAMVEVKGAQVKLN